MEIKKKKNERERERNVYEKIKDLTINIILTRLRITTATVDSILLKY